MSPRSGMPRAAARVSSLKRRRRRGPASIVAVHSASDAVESTANSPTFTPSTGHARRRAAPRLCFAAHGLQCVRSIRAGHRQLWHRFVIVWYRIGLGGRAWSCALHAFARVLVSLDDDGARALRSGCQGYSPDLCLQRSATRHAAGGDSGGGVAFVTYRRRPIMVDFLGLEAGSRWLLASVLLR